MRPVIVVSLAIALAGMALLWLTWPGDPEARGVIASDAQAPAGANAVPDVPADRSLASPPLRPEEARGAVTHIARPQDPQLGDHWWRRPTPEESLRLERRLEQMLTAAQETMWQSASLEDADAYQRYASSCFSMEAIRVASRQLQAGDVFFTRAPYKELRSTAECYYWNLSFRVKPEGDVWAFFPMRLESEHGLAELLRRRNDARQFSMIEKIGEWNNRPHEERKALWARRQEAMAVGQRLRNLESAWAARSMAEADYRAQKRAAQNEMAALGLMREYVPGRVDPVTFEAKLPR